MNIEELKREFTKHYNKYDVNDIAINRKYYHSLRVMELAKEIATSEKLSDRDIEIATISGLLHDYARFPQWTKYQTLSDIKSIDHGDLAVQMLFSDNEIANYTVKLENYDEIFDSIKYHNKKLIPENLSEHNKVICRVIRDADKIDIFYQLACVFDKINEVDSDISLNVTKDFFKNSIIDNKDMKNQNDEIIRNLAMIFDLNYKYSFKVINDKNYIWLIFDKLKNKERFKDYFEYIDSYIKERMI